MLTHGGNFAAGVVDFSVNTNPCVTKEKMSTLLSKHGHKALIYPEIDGDSLLTQISTSQGMDKTRLILGNGAIDCLYRAMAALRPKTAVIVTPTFSEYRRALELVGCQVHALAYDIAKTVADNEARLLETLGKVKADLVVLCNPNNPTGHAYTRAFMDELLKRQRQHKGYLMVDESFRFFEGLESVYRRDDWNLIVLTSLTKYYGIPGLRVGYLTANHSLIEGIRAGEMPWNINGMALAVTGDLMADEALKATTKVWYNQEKAYMANRLTEVPGITPLPSRANYFLCRLTGITGTALNEELLKQEVPMGVRQCASFPGLDDGYIRIGLKSHGANEGLMDALEHIMTEKGPSL